MVWSCFSYSGIGPLVPIEGTMNAPKYRNVITQHLVPQIATWFGNGRCVFQQDNAPCHKAVQVTRLLNSLPFVVMKWPAYSPDMSPIENLWSIMKQHVYCREIKSKHDLLTRMDEIWTTNEAIRISCQRLIEGMPRRIQACIDAKGGYTKY